MNLFVTLWVKKLEFMMFWCILIAQTRSREIESRCSYDFHKKVGDAVGRASSLDKDRRSAVFHLVVSDNQKPLMSSPD